MAEPVTADAARYYGYWTPWLWAAAAWAVAVICLLTALVVLQLRR